ncbi:MAG: hypothetical protein NTW87_22590 [Planctomycetota bacterium]|nr:hypothetical protein [Planctomycetota bacterium]
MSALLAQEAGRNRYVLSNECIRLDFDLRTSDTMYNYIWVRNPTTGKFERLYNFGCDVGARERPVARAAGSPGDPDVRPTPHIVNTIGVNMRAKADVSETEAAVTLTYPSPLVVYRQFEKASNPAAIWNYPDLPDPLPSSMRLADATLAVTYSLRKGEAAFTISAKHLGGVIENVTPILNAMWVDNEHVPQTMYIEDIGEFDWDRPAPVSRAETCDVRYFLFYNRDGSGLPYGLVVQGRQKTCVAPHPGNPDGEGVFKVCSTNQEFIPRRAPTGRFNDTNVYLMLTDSRITPPLRWVLFPELGWGQGGTGAELLARLRARTEEKHLSWWDGATRQPSVELFLRLWPARQEPATLWR